MRKQSLEEEGEGAGRSAIQSELALIRKAEGEEDSPVLGRKVNYGELKPCGHYASSEVMRTYFMAFKYLTQLAGEDQNDAYHFFESLGDLFIMGPTRTSVMDVISLLVDPP